MHGPAEAGAGTPPRKTAKQPPVSGWVGATRSMGAASGGRERGSVSIHETSSSRIPGLAIGHVAGMSLDAVQNPRQTGRSPRLG